jgi:hypothetical protein
MARAHRRADKPSQTNTGANSDMVTSELIRTTAIPESHPALSATRATAGSGSSQILIAPYQTLAASHVLTDLHRTDEHRADDVLRKHEVTKREIGYFVPPESIGVFQLNFTRSEESPTVDLFGVQRAWGIGQTDLSLIEVVPDDSTTRNQWPSSLDLQLLPPSEAARSSLWVFHAQRSELIAVSTPRFSSNES